MKVDLEIIPGTSRIIFFITDNNKRISYAETCITKEGYINIFDAFTEADYRGKRLFKIILQEIITYYKNDFSKIGITACQRESCIDTEKLICIYKKCGFIQSESNWNKLYLNI